MSEPLTDHHNRYAKWQEASRKDVKHAFGVLQRKFYFLVKDVEQWYVSDITEAVETCVILHSMMVRERVDRDEQELHDWYEYNNNDDAPTDNYNINNNDDPIHNNNINNNDAPVDPAEEFVEQQRAETDPHQRLQELFYDGPAIDVEVENYQQQHVLFNFRQEVINHRWECLHDSSEFFHLRDAIIAHVNHR
jgi:hypothetical protein